MAERAASQPLRTRVDEIVGGLVDEWMPRLASGEDMMARNTPAPVGFVGLGIMGEPMALNLAKAGTPLLVWNRSSSKCGIVAQAGATIARDMAEVFTRCQIVILMLADSAAIDAVLGRSSPAFSTNVTQHTIIHMGTTAPHYSRDLEADIRAAGGSYVEAPVSGSRVPAETGQLIAMLAGEPAAVESVQPILASICRTTVACGSVPNALFMKLAVNLYMINMVTGLAEAVHFAECHQLDLAQLAAILDAGPMASDLSRVKSEKLLASDFTKQAAITDVHKNTQLIYEAAREARIASPLTDVCHALYSETQTLGLECVDMVAVIRAIEQRTIAVS